MLHYDPEFAKVDAQYHQEKLIRQMQDTTASVEFVAGIFQKATTVISGWMQPNANEGTNRPIGGIQTNLR